MCSVSFPLKCLHCFIEMFMQSPNVRNVHLVSRSPISCLGNVSLKCSFSVPIPNQGFKQCPVEQLCGVPVPNEVFRQCPIEMFMQCPNQLSVV